MRLHARLIPPQALLDELDDVVRSIGGDASEFEHVPADLLHIPIASFGNVSSGDAVKLADALAREAANWVPVELRFAGGTALEWPGDESVWAKLDGDLEHLSMIGRSIPQVVLRLGYLVDRRKFRTWVSVGQITDSTTPEFLQGLVDALEAYSGPAWTSHELCLLNERWPTRDAEAEAMRLEVFRRIELKGEQALNPA